MVALQMCPNHYSLVIHFTFYKDPKHTTPSILGGPGLTMDKLREFLESSTIHGLTYISTAQVKM